MQYAHNLCNCLVPIRMLQYDWNTYSTNMYSYCNNITIVISKTSISLIYYEYVLCMVYIADVQSHMYANLQWFVWNNYLFYAWFHDNARSSIFNKENTSTIVIKYQRNYNSHRSPTAEYNVGKILIILLFRLLRQKMHNTWIEYIYIENYLIYKLNIIKS